MLVQPHNLDRELPPAHIPPTLCPSCHQHGTFTLLGEQTWPPAVAKRMGYSITQLWVCPHCETTISTPSR
ncbi:MAG: hypothetical protein ACOYLB_06715 [Phototrophicaceae bacterium]